MRVWRGIGAHAPSHRVKPMSASILSFVDSWSGLEDHGVDDRSDRQGQQRGAPTVL